MAKQLQCSHQVVDLMEVTFQNNVTNPSVSAGVLTKMGTSLWEQESVGGLLVHFIVSLCDVVKVTLLKICMEVLYQIHDILEGFSPFYKLVAMGVIPFTHLQ